MSTKKIKQNKENPKNNIENFGNQSNDSISSKEETRMGDNLEETDLIQEHDKNFDPQRWIKGMEEKIHLPRFSNGFFDPGPKTFQKFKENKIGVFVSKKNGNKATVKEVKNPQEKGSFGFIDSFALIEAKNSDINGMLLLRFDQKKLNFVIRSSLRIFRWDEKAKQYYKIPGSRVSVEGDYVFAHIKKPGIYAIIGINSHPLILRTTKIFCTMRSLMQAFPGSSSKKIRDRICQVILCSPEMFELIKNPRIHNELQLDDVKGGMSFPEDSGLIGNPPFSSKNLCDQCFGVDSPALPECQILEEPGPSGPVCTDSGWVSMGPLDLSGCIRQVVVDPSESNRIYAAAYNGGVWVLDDVNNYPTTIWRPLTDQLENLQMRSIAVSRSNNSVIYAANRLGFMYRSEDRGSNWVRSSNTNLGNVRKILIHPSEHQIVFVASNTGFYISLDGGTTWPTSYSGDILDAAMDPLDSSIIYIAERNVGILKTHTLGFGPWENVLAWSEANTPVSSMIKIALGVRDSEGNIQLNSDRTIAVKFGNEVFVSNHGGSGSWESKGKRGGNGYGDWCHAIAIDPFNSDIILAGQQELYRTNDGGENWTQVATYYRPHEDQQSIDFDPNNSGIVYLANDGGVFRSTDSGSTWYEEDSSITDEIAIQRSLVLGLVTAEFYRVGVQSTHAVGNLFHSGIIASSDLSSGSWRGIEGHAWEWNYVYSDPKRLGRYYVFHSKLSRRRFPSTGTDDFTKYGEFAPYTRGVSTSKVVGAIAVDTRSDSNTILVGAHDDPNTNEGYRLMITKEGHKEPFREDGGTITNLPSWSVAIDNDTEPIVSVLFAPSSPGKALAISNSGKIFSKDEVNDAGSWDEPGRWVTTGVRQLAINSANDRHLYAITSTRFARSDDGGSTWQEFGDTTLPSSEFNSLVAHPTNSNILYLGADNGVYISLDEGETWAPYDDQLPNAEILQIFWDNGHLYAVTHGRGLWRRKPC